MAAAIDSISQFAQVANVASKASEAIGMAQQAIAASKVAEMGVPLNMFATAEGTLASLDQLMKGPLLPRVQELQSLQAVAEALKAAPFAGPMRIVAEVRVERLMQEFSPAEMVQLALRGPSATRGGGDPFHLGRPLLRPDGTQIDIYDLFNAPLYPSVEERFSWVARAASLEDRPDLAQFCHEKAGVLQFKMSEAEAVQYRLIELGSLPRPAIDLNFAEPIADSAVGDILGELNGAMRQMSEPLKASNLAEKAQAIVAAHTAAVTAKKIMMGLDDAKLMGVVLATK